MRIEEWTGVKIEMDGIEFSSKYSVSNYGRIRSIKKDNTVTILKGSVIRGYKSLNVKLPQGKYFGKYVHVIVAEAFVERPSEEHQYVIHLDYDLLHNHFENLKWVTKEEWFSHRSKSPNMLEKKLPETSKQFKLTSSKVKQIKKLLQGNTRIKIIAKQFGVSAMQVSRIKSGENWKDVKI